MENIQKNKRIRRRCRNCGERITLYIFKLKNKKYCKCPKCGVSGRFYKINKELK